MRTGVLRSENGYDVFVTARYHGAVFASILGKPTVCIEIEQKLGLVSDLLCDGASLWTYPFNASKCLMHISDLEGDYSRSVECLARVVEEQGVLAEKMVYEFRQSIIVNSTGCIPADAEVEGGVGRW